MPFPTLDIAKPDPTTETLAQMGMSTREQITFIRGAVVAGTLFGFDMAASGGTADQPTTILHTKGVEQIKETITWGTTGGANGNPSTIYYEYSDNSGSSWSAIGTLTYSYDTAGNCTGGAWT